MATSDSKAWHRLFGLSWKDFFQGTTVKVDLETDLSLKQQYLDVVLIRTDNSPIPHRLPDGFDDLAPHNLVSFKSYQEALDGWALCELIGHYVNYRKQASPTMQNLLPESDFRQFAVCVRGPRGLSKSVELMRIQPGVYDVAFFTGTIRVIVVHELPEAENNAMLHLFSAQADLLRYGAEHYQRRSSETSSLLLQLFERYQLEVSLMPDTIQDFLNRTLEDVLNDMPVEKRLKGISVGDLSTALVASLPPEQRAELVRRLAADLPNTEKPTETPEPEDQG